MLHYIKVLLWTPAECMQRGTIKRRKKEKIDVPLLFSNSAASQRCRKFQLSICSNATALQVSILTPVCDAEM